MKAAEVTNHIKARKKEGVSHEEAKAEAYRLYKIKAALPILKNSFRISFAEVEKLAATPDVFTAMNLPPLPPLPKAPTLPPLPTTTN